MNANNSLKRYCFLKKSVSGTIRFIASQVQKEIATFSQNYTTIAEDTKFRITQKGTRIFNTRFSFRINVHQQQQQKAINTQFKEFPSHQKKKDKNSKDKEAKINSSSEKVYYKLKVFIILLLRIIQNFPSIFRKQLIYLIIQYILCQKSNDDKGILQNKLKIMTLRITIFN